MTPQEKAKDLIEKFAANYIIEPNGIVGTVSTNPKRCSVILCNEILDNGGNFHGMSFGDNEMWIDRQFWEQVKEEIQKL